MGTNSKTTHQSYTIAPAAFLDEPPAAGTFKSTAEAAAAGQGGEGDQQDQILQAMLDSGAAAPAANGAEPRPEHDDAAAPGGQGEAATDTPGQDAPADAGADRWKDALIPVPDTPPEGLATGVPVLIGGEDLTESTGTLVSYASPEGPREVLLATVSPEAEDKLMEALSDSAGKTVPAHVQQHIDGRLPLDVDKNLYEEVANAARSVNHKLKNGQPIPEHTKQYYEKALASVEAVLADSGASEDEKQMASYYAGHLYNIEARIEGKTQDKVPFVDPHKVNGSVTVTKQVPAPADGTGLPAALRNATRINPSLDTATGTSTWNGQARSKANGKEYLIDLGDGYSAVYRPYAANDPAKHDYSLRGELEVHAPQGAGHGQDLVRNLGKLNLVNRPMTAAEGEWSYLKANIDSQGLAGKPEVKAAMAAAGHMEDLQLQEIFHARQHQAAGLDHAGLQKLSKEFQLEAAVQCLPKKVAVMRDAVAKASGFPSGAELAAHAGYEPVPRRSGGWLAWSRFDVTARPDAIGKAWKGKRLVHSLHGGSLTDMFATGVLASTERRAVMGIQPGLGMSEGADKKSGGANSVFVRVRSSPSTDGPALEWDDPTPLISRSDYYAYNGDHYGAVNTAAGNTSGKTKDPLKIATFNSPSNEIMIRHGIDLLGAEAPSRIVCGSASERKKLLGLFTARGITHLGGKPVSDVVQ